MCELAACREPGSGDAGTRAAAAPSRRVPPPRSAAPRRAPGPDTSLPAKPAALRSEQTTELSALTRDGCKCSMRAYLIGSGPQITERSGSQFAGRFPEAQRCRGGRVNAEERRTVLETPRGEEPGGGSLGLRSGGGGPRRRRRLTLCPLPVTAASPRAPPCSTPARTTQEQAVIDTNAVFVAKGLPKQILRLNANVCMVAGDS